MKKKIIIETNFWRKKIKAFYHQVKIYHIKLTKFYVKQIKRLTVIKYFAALHKTWTSIYIKMNSNIAFQKYQEPILSNNPKVEYVRVRIMIKFNKKTLLRIIK